MSLGISDGLRKGTRFRDNVYLELGGGARAEKNGTAGKVSTEEGREAEALSRGKPVQLRLKVPRPYRDGLSP